MKKSTLHILNSLITGNNYHRSKAVKAVLFVVLMCGMSNVGFSQIIINMSTPTAIATASVCPSATNADIYAFTLAATNAGTANALTSVSFTQSGNAVVPTDIIQYKLWKNAGSGAGTLVATSTTTTFAAIVGENYPGGTTTNYWITADIAATPTTGRTITVNTMTTGNITVSGPGGTSGGGTIPGGTQKISINPTVASISGNTPLCVGGTLTLTAAGVTGPIGSYNWTGPAGYSSATTTNTQTYTVPATTASGTYSLTITPNGAGCVNNTVYTSNAITVNSIPTVASITASLTTMCASATLTLTATGASGTGVLTSYNWTGPGGYSSTSPGNIQTYVVPNGNASGVYTVSVTYAGSGCTSTTQTSASVTVNQAPVLPPTRYICTGDSTYITSGNTTGTWTTSNTAVTYIDPADGAIYSNSVSAGATTTITNHTVCGSASTLATIANRPSIILGPLQVCTASSIAMSDATLGGTWSSSITTIATVNNLTGVVTGTLPPGGSGGTTIIYTSSTTGCDTSIVVNVNPIPDTIRPTTDTVCVGSTITLTNTTASGIWSSSSLLLATVTAGPGAAGGVVSGVSSGLPVITYKLGTGCYVTRTVTVNPLPTQIIGSTMVCDNLCTTMTDQTPGGTWSSFSPAIATVGSTNPSVCGNSPGNTYIYYQLTATGCRVSLLLDVIQHPGPIQGPTFVCAGNTIFLTDAVVGGTWSTANSSIAAVGSTTALVYGNYGPPTPQTTNILYNVPSCNSVSYAVTVNPAPGPINGVQSVCIGFTTALSDTTVGGMWSNANTFTVPVVDSFTNTAPGVILGISAGFSIVTYTLPLTGCYDTAIVIVYPNPDSIRDVTGHIIHFDSVCQYATVKLVDSTPLGTWSSTNLGISQIVDSSGVDSGITAGVVNISYTLTTGCYQTIPLTVKPQLVASVSISKSPLGTTCAGTVDTFTAHPVNGGQPTYQWYKFVSPVSTASTYIEPPTNGDLITVMMTTHHACVVDTIVYDSVIANVYPVNTGPVVNITSSPTNTTATFLGQVFTFFANVTWGGLTPTYQWYVNGAPIPGATTNTYTTPVYRDGAYYCKVSGTTPCDNTVTVGTSNTIQILATYLDVGVDPLTISASNLVLFPNPTTGTIILSGTVDASSKNDLKIEINDILGHNVYSGATTPQNGAVKEQISLDNIPAGVYLLHVNSETVNRVFRFVISK